ncbi:MAG TPA: hypothetical protein VJH67_00265 [Candidatus Paceibacterota bacterium]
MTRLLFSVLLIFTASIALLANDAETASGSAPAGEYTLMPVSSVNEGPAAVQCGQYFVKTGSDIYFRYNDVTSFTVTGGRFPKKMFALLLTKTVNGEATVGFSEWKGILSLHSKVQVRLSSAEAVKFKNCLE